MKKINPFIQFAALVVFGALAASAQAAPQAVTSNLVLQKVISERGVESFQAADKVQPGETLQYSMRYENHGTKQVSKLAATLPIPAGMSFIAGTATEQGLVASTDGKNFAAIPLKRTVKLPSGETAEQNVSYSEYRFLRWNQESLGVGAHASFKARVQVNPAENQVAVTLVPR
jgi:uncharacterized repeat protein (TIGR01451 family)